MKRPGPLGLVLIGVFAFVFAIELRTVFGMVGIEIDPVLYYPGSILLIGLALGLLFLLTGRDVKGNPSDSCPHPEW